MNLHGWRALRPKVRRTSLLQVVVFKAFHRSASRCGCEISRLIELLSKYLSVISVRGRLVWLLPAGSATPELTEADRVPACTLTHLCRLVRFLPILRALTTLKGGLSKMSHKELLQSRRQGMLYHPMSAQCELALVAGCLNLDPSILIL